jgi:hypothetical protein
MNVVPANLAEPTNGFPGRSRGTLPTWQENSALPALIKNHIN